MNKLKITNELEELLNDIYTGYVLEDDEKLDKTAMQLKQHYKYVIEDLNLHNGLEIGDD